MRPLLRLAARLYPRAWRGRYGDEFEALLDDVEPTLHQLRSILWGALSLQLSSANIYFRFSIAAALAGLILSLGASFTQSPRYLSSADVRVTSHGSEEYAVRRLSAAGLEIGSRHVLVPIIQDLDLYQRERSRIPMEAVVELMRQDLRISVPPTRPGDSPDNAAVRIAFTYAEKGKAETVVVRLLDQANQINAFANRIQELLWRDLFQTSTQTPPDENPVLLTTAALATQTVNPNRFRFAILGLLAGLLSGLLAASVKRQPRRTVRVAGFALAGAAIGVVASFLIPQPYTSTATLTLTPPYSRASIDHLPALPLPEIIQQIEQEVFSPKSMAEIILNPRLDLYPEQRAHSRLDEIIHRMLTRDLSVRVIDSGSASVFTISFTYPDRFKATAVVHQMVARFAQRHIEFTRDLTPQGSLARRVLEHKAGQNLELLDPASVPALPVARALSLPVAGLLLGLLAGILATAFSRPRPTPLLH